MPTTLHTFVAMFDRVLDTADHLLDKGAEHAAGLGETSGQMLDWRLVDDMNPLRFQVMVVINFSRLWPAKVLGIAPPADVASSLDLAGFKTAIADAKTWLADLTPEDFSEIEDKPLTATVGQAMEFTLPSQTWITGFATTNIYFHLSMAYAILRLHGVKVGKMDLFPRGL